MPSLIFRSPSPSPPPRGEQRRAGRIHLLLRSFSARRPLAAPPSMPIGTPARRNAFFLKLPRWWRSVATNPSSPPPPQVKRGRVENSDNSTTIPLPLPLLHPRSFQRSREVEEKPTVSYIPPLDIYLYIYVCVCTSRKYVSGVEEKNGFFQLEDLALNRRLIYIYNEYTRVEYNDTCKGAGEEGISEAEEVSRFATARN